MKKTDKQNVIIINGDNNNISLGGARSHLPAIVIILVAVAVLAVSLCCPELLADFVRWIIGKELNS